MNKQLTHIDCFAGPGGICTGLHAAGFKTLVAIEYIKSCCDTYSANHPDVHVIHSDIRDVKSEQILPYIPEEGVDLVTSGMPCETFSTAGNTSRSFYDERQFLFREGIRIALLSNAKMILFENVPAITSKKAAKDSPELIVDIIRKELKDAGYKNMIQVVLDATKFGVPQKRNRLVLMIGGFQNLINTGKQQPFQMLLLGFQMLFPIPMRKKQHILVRILSIPSYSKTIIFGRERTCRKVALLIINQCVIEHAL